MTITEIEQAITQLSPQDYNRLREWFEAFDAKEWDEQLECDVAAGRLDKLLAKVNEEYEAGAIEI